MGSAKYKQLIVLAVLLLAVIFLVYRTDSGTVVRKPFSLRTALGPVNGYQVLSAAEVGEDIAAFLELDDYTQTTYQRDANPVSLYIGYYFSLAKLSSAHSPLICFPGQGWQLQDHIDRQLLVGPSLVHYAEMVASLGDRQELVLYWYQADRKTATQVYRNKLNALWNKLTGGSQEHAFVRVTVPFGPGERERARVAGETFITAFYPVFLDYISRETEPVATRLNMKSVP